MNKIAIAGFIVSLGLLITSVSTAAGVADSAIESNQIELRESDYLWYKKGADEPFTGSASMKYRNGMTQTTTYVDGRRTGATTWDESGQKRAEQKFDDSGELIHGKGWYENGQMSGEGEYNRGREHGLVSKWFENGQPESQLTYVNGQPQEGTIWDKAGNSRTFRPEVEEALNVLHIAKAAVAEYFMTFGELPVDAHTVGVDYYAPGLQVDAGVITFTMGPDAGEKLAGKTLILTPTASVDSLAFQCSSPEIAAEFLPKECRSDTSATAARGPIGPFISDDKIERRKDGLFYEIGADQPYTGSSKATYFGPGDRFSTHTMVDGIVTGSIRWFGNGQRHFESKFDSSGQVRHNTEWYENGQMAFDASFNEEGLKDGLVSEWSEDGQLKSQITYVNGEPQ